MKLLKEKHLYSFGEFNLNVEDQSLNRNGENIPITPKMFDLLLVLVQNPQRVLLKEFLLQSVWPDSFVEEGNITFNIRQLRKAMHDDAQSPCYIETIPRRGYRFRVPVAVHDSGAALRSPGAGTTMRLQKILWTNIAELRMAEARRRRGTIIGFAVLFVIVAVLAVLLFRK